MTSIRHVSRIADRVVSVPSLLEFLVLREFLVDGLDRGDTTDSVAIDRMYGARSPNTGLKNPTGAMPLRFAAGAKTSRR